jgi:hypothetical protein
MNRFGDSPWFFSVFIQVHNDPAGIHTL